LAIRKRICLLVALLTVTYFSSNSASAQIPDAAVAAGIAVIGKKTVGSVLDDLQKSAQNIGLIANNDANLDFGNALITLQASLQGVMNSLDNERSKVVNDLDTQRKEALLDVYVLSNDMLKDQLPADIASLEMDSLTVLNHVNLLGKKTPFMIGYIKPTVLSYKDTGDYDVSITGIGIGNQEGKELPTTVTLTPPDGRPIKITPTNTVGGITFTIPRTAVEQRFSNTSLYKVTVNIASVAPTDCGPLGVFTCQRPYSFEYSTVLFPKTAVSGTVSQITTTPSTDPSTRKAKLVSVTTPNGNGPHGGHMQTWATPAVVPDAGYQFTKIDVLSCSNVNGNPGDPCQFIYIDTPSMLPQNAGQAAQVTGRNNSWPVQLNFNIWEEKQTTISNPIPSFPVAFGAGETKPVVVRGDAVSVLMDLTSTDGRDWTIQVAPPGGLATDVVVCSGRTDIGGGLVQYLCQAKTVDFY
jgi:hypothetical protein